MGFDPNEPEQRRRLRAAIKAGEYEVEVYLQGLLPLPPVQRDLLALAANELIDDLPRPRAPYSDDVDSGPASGVPDSAGEGQPGSEDSTSRQPDRDE